MTGDKFDGDDIVDHKAIHPIMGNRDAFDGLKKIMRKKGSLLISSAKNNKLLIASVILAAFQSYDIPNCR